MFGICQPEILKGKTPQELKDIWDSHNEQTRTRTCPPQTAAKTKQDNTVIEQEDPRKLAPQKSGNLWDKFESAAKIQLESKESNFESFFRQKMQLFAESGSFLSKKNKQSFLKN